MNKINFDLGWEVTEATGLAAMYRAGWQAVDLPHDVAIARPRRKDAPSGREGGYAWSGVLTYRKVFQVPEAWSGLNVQLELEGVYMNAEVSLNRQLLALHPYGYTSFLIDLTPHLKFGQENELRVVANNSAPSNGRWYSGAGIYRHAWLRTGGSVHIKPWGVFVTTPVVDTQVANIQVVTELSAQTPEAFRGAVLRSTVLDAAGIAVAMVESPVNGAGVQTEATLQQMMVARDARLWSPDEPYLYSLRSEIVVNGAVVDTESTSFGIRSIAVDAQNGFRLNGAPLKMKGGCIHHDHGLLGAASYDRAEERKVELMKSAGYNAIRCAHNPPAPALLDACDRLGMLVIDESFDVWRTGKNPNDYHLYFEDWWQRDTEAMVKRDRNHPSVVMWSIGNEVSERTGVSDGASWAQRQADFVRALDPTRPVTSALHFPYEEYLADPNIKVDLAAFSTAQGMLELKKQVPTDPAQDLWGNLTREYCSALDVVGYNYLWTRYNWDHQRFPERVMACTESYPLLAYDFWKLVEEKPFVIGDFVWTAIDYLGESGLGKVVVDSKIRFAAIDSWPIYLAHCGDFDICGFKRPQSYYRDVMWGVRSEPYIGVLDPALFGRKLEYSAWGWEPVSASWSFPGQEGRPTRVDVYSAGDEVELLLNGVSLGRQPCGPAHKFLAGFDIVYQPGTLEAVSYQGGSECGRTSLATVGAPAGLRLSADRSQIHSQPGDLAYVTVEVVDAGGAWVPYSEAKVTVSVSGAGKLLALGTANPASEELFNAPARKAWQGRLMAVVGSTGQAGKIVVKARGAGLRPARIVLQAI